MRGFLKDVLEGKVREVRKWIEKGEAVSQYDEYGNTALHLAAEKGFRGVCKLLLDAGADVDQSNQSVGWSAAHYAAYEGHVEVLRMLLAHGATPDIADKSGDTPESYAAEWENTECVAILREATAARQRAAADRSMAEMFESDGDGSEDSDDDDDESSMMNWIMPPPSLPKPAAGPGASDDSSMHLSVHLQPPPRPQQGAPPPEDSCHASLPDLSGAAGRAEEEAETESEDTLQLMQETRQQRRAAKESSARAQGGISIVDTIRNNLQNSKQEQEGAVQTQEEVKICAGGGGRSEPASASRDALPSTYSRTLDASLSSATIPDDMTMSTCSVLDRLGPGDAGEKESLVRRLRELVLSEETEVDRNLAEAKQRLSRVEAEYARSVNELKQEAAKEEENLLKTQREEFALLQSTQAKEEERIEREIRKLEAELESILAPAKMLASLRNTASIAEEPRPPPSVAAAPELSSLESELLCVVCGRVCAPPRSAAIYQCPEGDLVCEECRHSATRCPVCSIQLCPALLSRNKVLENIARKYFKCA